MSLYLIVSSDKSVHNQSTTYIFVKTWKHIYKLWFNCQSHKRNLWSRILNKAKGKKNMFKKLKLQRSKKGGDWNRSLGLSIFNKFHLWSILSKYISLLALNTIRLQSHLATGKHATILKIYCTNERERGWAGGCGGVLDKCESVSWEFMCLW